MPFAHKLKTYRDDAYKNVVFCSICGQDTDLSGPCPGEPKFEQNFSKIFGTKSVKISNELKKQLTR